MNATDQFRGNRRFPSQIPLARRRAYWAAIGLASLACGGMAGAQTTNTPSNSAPPITNGGISSAQFTNLAVVTNIAIPKLETNLLQLTNVSLATNNVAPGPAPKTQPVVSALAPTNAPAPAAATNVTTLQTTTVVGQLDQARSQIVADLGATKFTVSKAQIEAQAQGENASFNQELLRAPGVAEDSLGQLHLRGEHANLQYRINDVLLPEGITGFGPELSPRFAETFSLITGSLPAEYGFRTAGVVDIHTKSGAFEQGGDVSMYGGSYNTLNPSVELSGSTNNWNYYFDGSYNHNDIGIENPTASSTPIHDTTDQYKLFGYLSKILDNTSRLSIISSVSYSDYQVPNTPNLPVGTDPSGANWNANGASGLPGYFDSATLNERQNEQNYYTVVSYQKSVGDFNMQVAVYGRESSVHFMPDEVGDLYFNGVASDDNRHLYSGGLQADFSYALNDSHTIRWGVSFLDELASDDSSTRVFDVNGSGMAVGAPFSIDQSQTTHGAFYSLYLQDEWKVFHNVTINYGARFDQFSSYINENQISPRVNGIYTPFESTTFHAGYARYFTPPPLEIVNQSRAAAFNGTSNASDTDRDDPVVSERANYFDAGVSQKILPGLQAGVDGYYKKADHQLDDGLFGQSLILSPFNYRYGTIEGVEFTMSYANEGFSSFGNVALSKAVGSQIESAQAIVGSETVNYSQNNAVYLDHDQTVTASAGVSYRLKESERCSTLFYLDGLFGSGLREDLVDGSGNVIAPNGATVPSYYEINIGLEHDFKITRKQHLKARFDVVNLLDRVYQLRNGTGVGVNASQYGERRGFFGGLTYVF